MNYIKNNEIKVEEIDNITLYKMIEALLKYDYFSTKCLVEVFIEKRTDKKEIEELKEIQRLLFENKTEKLEEILNKKITTKT